MFYLLLFLVPFFSACTSHEEKMRKKNLKGEYIYRLHDEYFFTPSLPRLQSRTNHPWEEKFLGNHPRITKEFFKCKGSPLNPVVIQIREGKDPVKYYDCQGCKNHGLPLKDGKEFIYPCLIEIVNYIQEMTGHKVVITCGHRCPKHNLYADYSPANWGSKHMLGAEVDFYVEGMENQPEMIIQLIQTYYLKTQPFSSSADYTKFHRYEKEGLNVKTPPWFNKEVFIKLYLEHEGRDIDNNHPYPYLSIQVRHDRDLNTKVVFDQRETQNYLRH